jgi:hypothetical protein
MAIKNFIKENFVLCVGISLPILLVVMFLLSNTLPRFFAAPPQYKLVLADYQVHYNGPRAGYSVAFQVDKDGKLQMRLTPVTDGYSSHTPHLLIYDGQRDSFRKVDISLPDAGAYTGAVTLPVKEVENYKLDTNNKAPDGYAFLQGRGGSRGVIGIFGGGYSHHRLYLKKGAASFKLPEFDGFYGYYGTDAFIGWVVEEK